MLNYSISSSTKLYISTVFVLVFEVLNNFKLNDVSDINSVNLVTAYVYMTSD